MGGELPPPFVTVAGLANFRDIGGWPILDANGKKTNSLVRSGIFYRGPDPSSVEPVGLARLKDLRISVAFDLRSKKQVERAGGVIDLDGIERIPCPVFGDAESGPEKAAARYMQYSADGTAGIVEAFSEILTAGAPVFCTILRHLSSLSPSDTCPAALVHCSTGNNRTGALIGVLHSFLHVSHEDIAAEYALSEDGLAPSRETVVARLAKSPIFAKLGENAEERAQRMVGARPESMLAMLKMVDSRWGGAESYFREVVGLSTEEINKLRLVMTKTMTD